MSFVDPRSPRAHGDAPSASASRWAPEPSEIVRRKAVRQPPTDAAPLERPRGSSYRRSTEWERVWLVGAGLVVGALIGAGTALLLAPQSGAETRVAIGRRARSARERAADAWDDLADEMARMARHGRRRARRALTRAKWRASDAIS